MWKIRKWINYDINRIKEHIDNYKSLLLGEIENQEKELKLKPNSAFQNTEFYKKLCIEKIIYDKNNLQQKLKNMYKLCTKPDNETFLRYPGSVRMEYLAQNPHEQARIITKKKLVTQDSIFEDDTIDKKQDKNLKKLFPHIKNDVTWENIIIDDNTLPILKKYINKIDWGEFCKNQQALPFIKEYGGTYIEPSIFANPAIFKLKNIISKTQ